MLMITATLWKGFWKRELLARYTTLAATIEKTNLDLVTTLCEILDELIPDSPHKPHKSLVKFVKDRPGHDRRYAIDAGKIKRELDWEPAETLDTGLRKTVQWYLDHPGWIENIMSGAYKGQRLGLDTVIAEDKND